MNTKKDFAFDQSNLQSDYVPNENDKKESSCYDENGCDNQFEQKTKTETEAVLDQLINGFEGQLDHNNKIQEDSLKNDGIVNDGFVKSKHVNFTDLNDQFEQSVRIGTEYSNAISDKIQIQDLNKECSDLIQSATLNLRKLAEDRTLSEKLIDIVPFSSLQNKLREYCKIKEIQNVRSSTVKSFAENHFNTLDDKFKIVNESRIAVDEIKHKLMHNNKDLILMKNEINAGLLFIEENKSTIQSNKRDEINGKNLLNQVQRKLIEQHNVLKTAVVYEKMAEIVSTKLSNTIPQLRSEFIDQTSIAVALTSLSDLRHSLDATQDLVYDMQNSTLTEVNSILKQCNENGLGDTPAQKKKKLEIEKKYIELKNLTIAVDNNLEANLNKDLKEQVLNIKELEMFYSDDTLENEEVPYYFDSKSQIHNSK